MIKFVFFGGGKILGCILAVFCECFKLNFKKQIVAADYAKRRTMGNIQVFLSHPSLKNFVIFGAKAVCDTTDGIF